MNNLLSCRYNMDTNRVESRFTDGSAVAIDCTAIEDEYGNTPAQRAELDWLLYNKPLDIFPGKRKPLFIGKAFSRIEAQNKFRIR